MTLSYLDFEYSEDAAGAGSFDAVASTLAERVPAVLAELNVVLRWANDSFAGLLGPLDEGFEWDVQLSCSRESVALDKIAFDLERQKVVILPGEAGPERHTLSISISGTPAFCDAFRERFGVD